MKWLMMAALVVAGCGAAGSVVTPVPIAPAPTVTLLSTEVVPYFARITWQVTNGTGKTFQIDRQLNDRPWKRRIFVETTNVDGVMVLGDPSVQPGQTYRYRVLAEGDAPDAFQGATTIVVPVP